MTRSLPWLLSAVLLLAVPVTAATNAKLTGTATYRERVALTKQAVFEATLEDVSRADGWGEVLGRVKKANPGQVPIRFEIGYDPAKIVAGRRYVVRATLHDGGQLRFTTTESYPVLTNGYGTEVALTLRAATSSGNGAAAKPASALGPLPATFTGLLPCADCMGIRYQVNVLPGGAYLQRTTYLRDGTDQSFYEIGSWSLANDDRLLTLKRDGMKHTRWSVESPNTLRKLDNAGNPIKSEAPHELTRSASVEPMQPRARLVGMFRYMADAARFRHCSSGLSWPVEMSGDYKALERAYAKDRRSAGAELMVSLQGRIEERPKMEGAGTEPTLIVERFVAALPDQKCEDAASLSGLTNTRWRPVEIGKSPVVVVGQQKEPWIVLEAKSHGVTGSGGCNRFTGSYEAVGDSLRFKRMVVTMMACPDMETEQRFLRALDETRRYSVSGRQLTLLDSQGRTVARLEERNLE